MFLNRTHVSPFTDLHVVFYIIAEDPRARKWGEFVSAHLDPGSKFAPSKIERYIQIYCYQFSLLQRDVYLHRSVGLAPPLILFNTILQSVLINTW